MSQSGRILPVIGYIPELNLSFGIDQNQSLSVQEEREETVSASGNVPMIRFLIDPPDADPSFLLGDACEPSSIRRDSKGPKRFVGSWEGSPLASEPLLYHVFRCPYDQCRGMTHPDFDVLGHDFPLERQGVRAQKISVVRDDPRDGFRPEMKSRYSGSSDRSARHHVLC